METAPDDEPTEQPLSAEEERDKRLRALAELENFRKRMNREVEVARDQGEARAASAFLDLADDFRRLIEATETAKGRSSRREIVEGVQLLFGKFQHVLRQLEIEGFEAHGQRFTAELMEAIVEVPTKELPPGTVTAEVSQGFMRRGKLLRAARVAVAVPEPDKETP